MLLAPARSRRTLQVRSSRRSRVPPARRHLGRTRDPRVGLPRRRHPPGSPGSPAPNNSPNRVVNWLSAAPKTTATSAWRTSAIAPSAPKPPVTPRSNSAADEDPTTENRRAGDRSDGVGDVAQRVPGSGEPRAASGEQIVASALRPAPRRASMSAARGMPGALGSLGVAAASVGNRPRPASRDVVRNREHDGHRVGESVLDRLAGHGRVGSARR